MSGSGRRARGRWRTPVAVLAITIGVRAMIGDQVDAGIDMPTDGHLW
jgi:hypothetical protein